MLDLPNHPRLDKDQLLGACVRLKRRADAAALQRETAALPDDLWGSGGRVGVHRAAEAIFLRGYAPAQGDRPIEDREVLAGLPYIRKLVHHEIPAAPLRCLLARLPAGASIAPHRDQAPYFDKSIRLHVPIITNPDVGMYCGGWSFSMAEGEIWSLNNSTTHAVWNDHPTDARLHLICDFLPSAALLELIASGDRDLGQRDSRVDRHLGDAGTAAPAFDRPDR